MCLLFVKIPLKHIYVSDNECNMDDQISKSVETELFPFLNAFITFPNRSHQYQQCWNIFKIVFKRI